MNNPKEKKNANYFYFLKHLENKEKYYSQKDFKEKEGEEPFKRKKDGDRHARI